MASRDGQGHFRHLQEDAVQEGTHNQGRGETHKGSFDKLSAKPWEAIGHTTAAGETRFTSR